MTSPLGLRLGAITAASFLTIGVHQPFFPVWLESRGLDAPMIGLLLAIPILVRIVVTAPIVSLADGRLGARGLLILATSGLAAAYALFHAVDGVVAIALVVGFMAVASCAIIPTTDLIVTEAARRDRRIVYSRVRLWGSIGYLAATLFAGYVLEGADADAILHLLVALGLAAVAAATLAPGGGGGPADAKSQASPRPRLPPTLWLFIAAGALVQASHAGVYAFGSLHWRSLGYDKPAIAWFWIIGVICEIGLFWILGRRIGPGASGGWAIVLGCLFATVRFAGLAIDPGGAAILALQALHAVSFGVSHLGIMAVLTSLSPEGGRGRAQGLYATATALAMAAATLASGPIYRAGGPLLFLAMTPLAVAGAGLALWALRRTKAQPQREAAGGSTLPPS
jgi:PPP family 3-phenylpropionic acid transporter